MVTVNGEHSISINSVSEISEINIGQLINPDQDFVSFQLEKEGFKPLKLILPVTDAHGQNLQELLRQEYGSLLHLRLPGDIPSSIFLGISLEHVLIGSMMFGFMVIFFLLFLIANKNRSDHRRALYRRKPQKEIPKKDEKSPSDQSNETKEKPQPVSTEKQQGKQNGEKDSNSSVIKYEKQKDFLSHDSQVNVPDLKPGTVFDDYRLDKIIGRGGISTIYAGRDSDGKLYAIKLMSRYLDDMDMVGRFFVEGTVLEKLNEECPDAPIVKLKSIGKHSWDNKRMPYLVLEYINGISLKNRILSQPSLTSSEKLHIAKQLLEALRAIHCINVVHRDLSPDNVIIRHNTDSEICLIDFGVVKYEVDWMKNTSYGAAYGKPEYMSPEQFSSPSSLDYRSDYYSLGVLMYHMFTGNPPFSDTNIYIVSEMHQTHKIPEIPEYVPPKIRKAIKHLMEKSPENRPSSIDDIIKYLKE